MNKQEFLDDLRNSLSGFPQADAEERVSFYGEMIDDRIEEGMSEEEAVAGIGTLADIREQIISEIPLPKLVKEKAKTQRRLKAWEIVLIVLGFPLWLPLLAAFSAVMLALYICVWAVIISLWAAEVSLWAGALAGVAAAVMFFIRGFAVQAIALLGAAVFAAGFSVLFFIVCRAVTKGLLYVTKKIMFSLKAKLAGKEDAQ